MAARAALASSLPRLSSPSLLPAKFIPRRGLSAGGGYPDRKFSLGKKDHHGPPRVNLWEDPLSPSKWKEEHLVLASLSGWGVVIYGGYKFFSGGKKEEVAAPTPQ